MDEQHVRPIYTLEKQVYHMFVTYGLLYIALQD